jgi:acyl carrier protein
MIPSLFVVVEKIPTTINEKVDFSLLKNSIVNKNKLVQGKTSTERALFGIISRKIKNNNLSPKDNLLDAGVTSIDLVEILCDIKAKFQITNISILDLFQYSSIEKLANYIDSQTNCLVNEA